MLLDVCEIGRLCSPRNRLASFIYWERNEEARNGKSKLMVSKGRLVDMPGKLAIAILAGKSLEKLYLESPQGSPSGTDGAVEMTPQRAQRAVTDLLQRIGYKK